MPFRIGIDVGGTFTDAVLIDDTKFELVGCVKVPTTHSAPEGVAAGIIQALRLTIEKYGIPPEEVSFIAHGTTQATNALLEGDVVPVAVLGIGQGIEGYKVKSDTDIGEVTLAPGKILSATHEYLEQDSRFPAALVEKVTAFKDKGVPVMVAAAAYSVDDPTPELIAMEEARSQGLIATGTHEMSKLYGLRIRTRTAVINAGILPKMVDTAIMTESSVKNAQIAAPLMIMRCDGGVMNIEEMKKRPILTMLSGPAAGVAGALMYEKVSEGIFLEVGGTSTDISAIHNGQVVVDYAEVGGHKTYVNSLDVRTVGVAGGSMLRVADGRVVDVGPRSAHIAGLPYLVYANAGDIQSLSLELVSPRPGDPAEYVVLRDQGDRRYALTLSCAANATGYTETGHYAAGNPELARKGFEVLAQYLKAGVDDVLEEVNRLGAVKNSSIIDKLIADYSLDRDQLVLVGGGGGAGAVVPYLAKAKGMKYRIARNAEVISPIGVALAMVRDVVERTVANPSEEDIRNIRLEVEQAALKSGAAPGTIEIHIEVDARRNLVRATATGATDFKTGERRREDKGLDELALLAAESMQCAASAVRCVGETSLYCAFQTESKQSSLWGLMSRTQYPARLITRDGVIRLQKKNARVVRTTAAMSEENLVLNMKELTDYNDGGEKIPEIYLVADARLIDMSGLTTVEQVLSLHRAEIAGCPPDTPVLQVICNKTRN